MPEWLQPVLAAIFSFVFVGATASALVAGTLYLFFLIKEGRL